mmetsp:Transcript_16509/g.18353  ORF Transcript_16509/g.18353 Transcript_16509/m.18353 type:complete len:146 (+) Transcript_16509:42-479(+)
MSVQSMSLEDKDNSNNFHEEETNEDSIFFDEDDTQKPCKKYKKADISMASTYISDLNTIKEEGSEFEVESESSPTSFHIFSNCSPIPSSGKSKNKSLNRSDLQMGSLQNFSQLSDDRKRFSENQPLSNKMSSVWQKAVSKGPKSP